MADELKVGGRRWAKRADHEKGVMKRRCGRTVRSMRRKYVLMSDEESESKRAAAPRPRTQSKAKPPSRQVLQLLASSPDRSPCSSSSVPELFETQAKRSTQITFPSPLSLFPQQLAMAKEMQHPLIRLIHGSNYQPISFDKNAKS